MEKRTLLVGFLLFSLAAVVSAHTPLLMLEDNEDGTLTVEGGFSTGAGAGGVDFYVKNKMEGEILLHRKFPESSLLEIEIPNEPYYLVFDGGPGHKVVKDGPAPPGGFTLNVEAVSLQPEKSDASGIPVPLPVIILVVVIAVLFVFLLPRLREKKKAK